MKTKSKKSRYVVECSTRKRSNDVINYVRGDIENHAYYRYIYVNIEQKARFYEGFETLKDLFNHFDQVNVISFQDWKNLPDEEFVLPEKWCVKHYPETLIWIKENAEKNGNKITKRHFYNFPADEYGNNSSFCILNGYTEITLEQFKEHVLGEKEVQLKSVPVSELKEINPPFDKDGNLNFYKSKPATLGKFYIYDSVTKKYVEGGNKKIIGYKLVKEEYKEAVRFILLKYDSWFRFDERFDKNFEEYGVNFYNNNTSAIVEELKKSGVLDLWFEPVYESSTEEKIMDYLAKKGTKLTKEEAEDIVKIVNEK